MEQHLKDYCLSRAFGVHGTVPRDRGSAFCPSLHGRKMRFQSDTRSLLAASEMRTDRRISSSGGLGSLCMHIWWICRRVCLGLGISRRRRGLSDAGLGSGGR